MVSPVFEWGPWTYEPREWRLTSAHQGVVSLPNKSVALLRLLLERAPGLVSKDEILGAVWSGTVVEEGNIAFHVGALRKTLDAPGRPSCLETVRGRGYRFVAPVVRRATADTPAVAVPEPIAPAAVVAGDEATRAARAAPRVSGRLAATWWPAAFLASAVSLLAWSSLSNLSPRVAPANGPDAEIQTLILQARESWRQRTPPSVQQAIALYERVKAIDPSFAPAYAGLADCYNLTLSGLPAGLRYERAKQNAERALALDPTLAAGHTALAFVRYKFEWKWREADAGFRRAIAADPSYALARHWYGEFLGLRGRHQEAVEELRRALALEPGSLAIQSDLVPPLLRAGRIAEARAVVEAAAKVNPNWHWIPRRMSEVLAAEGRERESLEEFWRALVLSGATLDAIEPLRAAYRAGGMPALLRLEIAQLEAGGLAPAGVPQQATFLSFKYAHLGDRDQALHWIGVALDRREDAAIHLRTHPGYESLRGDPRFDALLARAGLPRD